MTTPQDAPWKSSAGPDEPLQPCEPTLNLLDEKKVKTPMSDNANEVWIGAIIGIVILGIVAAIVVAIVMTTQSNDARRIENKHDMIAGCEKIENETARATCLVKAVD